MAKKPTTTRHDQVVKELADIIAKAIAGDTRSIVPNCYLVKAEDMELLIKLGTVYEHYHKNDIKIDQEMKINTARLIAVTFHASKMLTQSDMDHICEALQMCEKHHDDIENSAEWEDKHIGRHMHDGA